MNSLIGWPGGKKNLVKRLVGMIPPHRTYVEPFCGSAKLLFSKPPSEVEIINDIHGDLINFFRVAKHRPAALAELMAHSPAHRNEFETLKASRGSCADEIRQAYRFYYLARNSFGSKGQHFNQLPRCNIGAVRAVMRAASRRLAKVLIECRDFEQIVKRYDGAETFFYCDPPYAEFSSNGRYVAGAGTRVFEVLPKIKGKFLVSYSWDAKIAAEMRKLGFVARGINTTWQLNRKASKTVREMLVANYELKAGGHA